MNKDNCVLYMADSHVRKRTWTNSSLLENDAYAALTAVVHELKNRECNPKALLIGGDWFDSTRPSAMDLSMSYKFREAVSGDKTIAIGGNHDQTDPLFMLLGNNKGNQMADLSQGQLVSFEGIRPVVGFGWTSKTDQLHEFLKKVKMNGQPSTGLTMLLHCGLRELLGFEATWQLELKMLEEMFSDWNITILIGHVHTRKTFQIGEHAFVHSPGALFPCSSDKMGEHHFVSLIDVNDGTVEDIPCDVRSYSYVRWEDDAHLDKCLDEASAHKGMLPTFVRVDMGDSLDMPSPKRRDDCIIQYVRHEAAEPETETVERSDEYTMEDAVREELSYDKDLADMAVKLLGVEDPLAELQSWLEFWGVEQMSVKKVKKEK